MGLHAYGFNVSRQKCLLILLCGPSDRLWLGRRFDGGCPGLRSCSVAQAAQDLPYGFEDPTAHGRSRVAVLEQYVQRPTSSPLQDRGTFEYPVGKIEAVLVSGSRYDGLQAGHPKNAIVL